jgi:large subunit ribosomal protein L25
MSVTQAPVLPASPRERLGTRYARRFRDSGRLPAVVYGHKRDPLSVTLDARDTVHHIRKGERVFRLGLPGESGEQYVLLKAIQFDYLGSDVVHADFMRVDLNERVRTKVPVHLVGEAVGLKTAGAVLIHPTNDVEIECTVASIPEHLEVEVSALEVGQSITAGAITLPDSSMKMITDIHSIVAQIILQLEEKVAEEVAVEAGAAEPELIKKEKKEEGEEGAEGAKKGEKAEKPEKTEKAKK